MSIFLYPLFFIIGFLPFIIFGGIIWLIVFIYNKQKELSKKSNKFLEDISTIAKNSKKD